MYTKGDFHLHTHASDGSLSPKALVTLAKTVGVDFLAVTDHDTTDGTKDAIHTGIELGVKVIPGIELSTLHKEESVHILGYFKDQSYKEAFFQNFLKDMQQYRKYRGKKIIENLSTHFHIELNYDSILEKAEGVIARPHIANAILESGYPYTWEYIFDFLLHKNSPAYVPIQKITIEDGIALLKKVNAMVVLAHPGLLKKSTAEELLSFDFDGIEAIYPLHEKEETEKYLSLAEATSKCITAGSDFHSLDARDTRHSNVGSVFLEGQLLEEFAKRLQVLP